jgi:lipoprotein-anchoring transpeptidase ErfK/SrfK
VIGTTRCAGLAAVLVTAAGAGAGAATASAQTPVVQPGQPLGTSALLSDEFTLSRYAFARIATPIHKTASRFGGTVGRLRYQTEDGFPEPYLVLRLATDSKGRKWVQVRVPRRPNGRTGWVARGALARFHVVDTSLRINRSTLRATLYRDGKRVWSSRVGVGTPSTPTPAGHYIVRERFRIGKTGGIYGPYAFGTSAYSVLSDWPRGGVVGIHGTNAPGLIPGRPSHGCVRVRNEAILRLARLMPIGTPIEIV